MGKTEAHRVDRAPRRFLARGGVQIRRHMIEMIGISFAFALLDRFYHFFIAFAMDSRFACSIYTSRFNNTPSSCTRSNRGHVLRWWGMYLIEESVWMVEMKFWCEILVICMYGLYRDKIGMSSLAD